MDTSHGVESWAEHPLPVLAPLAPGWVSAGPVACPGCLDGLAQPWEQPVSGRRGLAWSSLGADSFTLRPAKEPREARDKRRHLLEVAWDRTCWKWCGTELRVPLVCVLEPAFASMLQPGLW